MSLHDVCLLLLGAALDILATAAIVFAPEILDCVQTLLDTDSWPGEH
jgi:hypothetical protein